MIYNICFVHFLVIILVALFVCLFVCYYYFYYIVYSYWLLVGIPVLLLLVLYQLDQYNQLSTQSTIGRLHRRLYRFNYSPTFHTQ